MKNLIRKNQTLPLMRIILVIVSILVVLFVSLYWWRQTVQWHNLIISQDELWYSLPELSRMEIRDSYNLAFKKIILFGGFIFTSTFLLLKAIDDKK